MRIFLRPRDGELYVTFELGDILLELAGLIEREDALGDSAKEMGWNIIVLVGIVDVAVGDVGDIAK